VDYLKSLNNLIIETAHVDDALCDENGMGIRLFVYFDNGSSISFPLDSKADEPLIQDVMKTGGGKFNTDGKRIYWQNGASLSIPEMMTVVVTAG